MTIFWTAFAVAIVLLVASYWIAGPIWRKYSIHIISDRGRFAISAAYGELIIFAFSSSLLVLVAAVSSQTSITQIVSTYWPMLTVFFGVAFVLQSVTGWGIGGKSIHGTSARRAVLARHCYRIYESIFLTGILAALLILFDHASVQLESFEKLAQIPRNALETHTAADTGTLLRTLEWSSLDMQVLLRSNYDILDPTLVFAVGIFLINLFVLMTPLRTMSSVGQIHQTLWALMVALLTLLAVCIWLYTASYYPVLNDFTQALEAYGAKLQSAPAGVVERYSEIVLDFSVQRTAYWFVSNMIFSNGGALILIGLAASQFLFEGILRWNRTPADPLPPYEPLSSPY